LNIQITGRHVEITEALKQYSKEKISTLSKFSQKIQTAHIRLDVQNNIHHKCEINIMGKNIRLSSHADTKNMYESISKSVEKLSHQLKSQKYSNSDKNHRTATKSFEQEVIELNNEEEIILEV